MHMNLKPIVTVAVCFFISDAHAQEVIKQDIEVSAKANVYYHEILNKEYVRGGAGEKNITLDVRGIRIVTFENASGEVSCFGDEDSTYYNADGGKYGHNTNVLEVGPLTGIVHREKVMFLTGVFTSEDSRLDTPYPALDYTKLENEPTFEPTLNRVFFIGDGINHEGKTQEFYVPRDAEELHIGFADCLEGPPSNYRDNEGTIKITVVLHPYHKGKN